MLLPWVLAAGTVWEIKVKVGDAVKAGDTLVSADSEEPALRCFPGLLSFSPSLLSPCPCPLLQIVLEAMKMEAAVVAPCDGTVKDIHVLVADLVQQGNPLCLVV